MATRTSTPPPSGRLVDASAQTAFVLRYYGHESAPLPPVVLVPDDGCAPAGVAGYTDPADHQCHGGTLVDGTVYLAAPPSGRWSDTGLPHELLHYLGFNHDGAPDWAPGSVLGEFQTYARGGLATQPALDAIR